MLKKGLFVETDFNKLAMYIVHDRIIWKPKLLLVAQSLSENTLAIHIFRVHVKRSFLFVDFKRF